MKLKSKIFFLITTLLLFISLILSFLIVRIIEGDLLKSSNSVLSNETIQDILHKAELNIAIVELILIVAAIAFALILSTQITKSVVNINEGLKLLEKGALPETITISGNDEIAEIGKRINSITSHLKDTACYSEEIGKGNFDGNFHQLSEDDVLRNSLIGMTNSLQNADKREKERAWVINGIAEIGDVLRKSNTLDILSDNVVRFLVNRVNAVQGAFYVVESADNEKSIIVMKSAYAYNRKKYIQRSFAFGEGLVGQSTVELSSILRTEIPDDYCSITSGILGDIKPSCIFICPLISDDKVFGVIEFAGLHEFSANEIKLIEESGPIIARTIFNIQVTENTNKHLEESKRMSFELQVQQEELRQNAEEMHTTQEELQRSNVKLEEQIEQVKRAHNRTQSLLENASEVIMIFDESGKTKYVSPSVENILGYDSKDLVGSYGIANIHSEDADEFKETFKSILKSTSIVANLQFRYKLKNGEWIWLEAIGRNMLGDPSVSGIVFNSRDITVKRKAEIEERMRRNMQALSENSPDLITRISCDGKITYTNPVIELYTGYNPSEFIGQNLSEITIGDTWVYNWESVLEAVNSSSEKISLEVSNSTSMGNRIMQVNAIPEFNDGVMESVLIVSHDITERKVIETEIKEKNKNINESINYSRRIQNAIIPDNKLIQSALPDSFILYKPRDVVSGDFPWFRTANNQIYIAAVDCTGHGVPGAMLSLVGYFQLTNIVENHNDFDPGQILDLLDEKVNDTLIKTGNADNIKDGMDIAFCKIDLQNNSLEYAGAHRPLYYVSKNGFEELKGNRWAIGGGTYKNQTLFTNYKINFRKGESVFFFSDGFPDQFGGPEKRKFGTTRIKSIIESNPKASMPEMQQIFNNEFNAWVGNGKQTDDVLMVGIKF